MDVRLRDLNYNEKNKHYYTFDEYVLMTLYSIVPLSKIVIIYLISCWDNTRSVLFFVRGCKVSILNLSDSTNKETIATRKNFQNYEGTFISYTVQKLPSILISRFSIFGPVCLKDFSRLSGHSIIIYYYFIHYQNFNIWTVL